MKIHVIGAGFVGEASGKGFLAHQNEVAFIDVDPQKINRLRNQGLRAFLPQDIPRNEYADVSILTVNTPTHNKVINLDYIRQAAADLGKRLAQNPNYHVIVVRSTVLPGTSYEISDIIAETSGKKLGGDFGLCMNPEFLREKTATEDFANPWLVVIGEHDQASGDVLEKLYQPFNTPIHRVNIREAEMQKYIHNLYNAVKITFFNEMREVAKLAEIDSEKIFPLVAKSAEGMWRPEYGIKDFGPFDGSCLPKDTQAFLAWATTHDWATPLLAATVDFNNQLLANTPVVIKATAPNLSIASRESAVAG